jgi:hypothetical protein
VTRLFSLILLSAALVACEGEHGHPHEAPAAPTPEGAADKEIRDKEHGDHDHGAGAADPSAHATLGSHGGEVKTLGALKAEALFTPAGLMVWVTDAAGAPAQGVTGEATIQSASGVVTAPLGVMSDHLHAPATLTHGQAANAVLTLKSAAGEAKSGSWSVAAVGLSLHDHTPMHGGAVGMWGATHVEIVREDGALRFYVSDARRAPITAGVSGAAVIGAERVPLTFDPATGALSGAAPGDTQGQPVTLEATVQGAPVTLTFQPG